MKKKIVKGVAVAATLALAGVLAGGCGGSSSSSSSAASSVAPEGNVLKVGFDEGYPPYGFIGDDLQFTGFDLDLAQEVANRNGWDIELDSIDWNAKDADLNQGNVNCLWNGFTMEGREGQYAFSDPYMLNEQVIVTKADSDIKSKDDLAGKVVITQLGSAADELLDGDEKELKGTFKELVTVPEYNTAFMTLEQGGADAVICDLSIADYQMAANPDAYVMLEKPLSQEHYVVAFKLGDEDVAKKVSETLVEMYKDGTVQQIAEKYADKGLNFDNWILVD